MAQWCLDRTVAYLGSAASSGGWWVPSRLSSTVWPTCGWRSSRPGPPPGRPRTRWPPASPDAPVAVAVAQAYCAAVAVHAAQECVQLHGGIGMTWEHPAHLYLKRAKADELVLGTPGRHRGILAEAVDLPPAG